MENWIKLQDLQITSDTSFITVDTRDFKCHPINGEIPSEMECPVEEDSLVTEDEMMEFLDRIRKINSWKELFWYKHNDMKYVRLKRVGELWAVLNRNSMQINPKIFFDENKMNL